MSEIPDFKQLVWDTILDTDQFVNAVFSGQQRAYQVRWKKVRLRPVLIKDQQYIQFSYFDERQDITKNYRGEELETRLTELLDEGFNHFHLKTTHGDIQIRITKKGKVMIHEDLKAKPINEPNLSHDRTKAQPIDVSTSHDFLQAIGIVNQDGSVKASRQNKLRQINEFLRLMEETGELQNFDHEPLHVVDCGCGSAYLTFAAHHYLNRVLSIPTYTIGIDVNESLIEKRTKTAQNLGWDDIRFQPSPIIEFVPEITPDITLALHACDTATDEALAQAIRWESHLIFSSPCCHHHLQAQLAGRKVSPFELVMQHGILKERLGDILTDAFRAAILKIFGYHTQVIEFISDEHTNRNLMIRAIYKGHIGMAAAVSEYQALKTFWGVTPYLETLLADEISLYLDADYPIDS